MPLVYVPYAETLGVPNVIVDGSANRSTVLALSHWPGTRCPDDLRADLSAEMAFRYLDRGADLHDGVAAVTNNHFDEDGVAAMFALVDPEAAVPQREFLIDVARAGDFGRFHHRDAARASMTITALAERDARADSYREILPGMATLRRSLGDYRELWAEEDEWLTESEAAVASGRVTIVEHEGVDLAVVTAPAGFAPHEMAIHNRTDRLRVLTVRGRHMSLRYRYESWVLYRSARPLPRVDLRGLASRLTDLEPGDATWSADPLDDLTPELAPAGDDGSDLDPTLVETSVRSWLLAASDTWSPYDSDP